MKNFLPFLCVLLVIPAHATEKPINIPIDPGADYVILGKSGEDNIRTLTLKRTGLSGIVYSRQQFDCQARTAKYLGTGSSLDILETSLPDRKMSPIVSGTVAHYLGLEACS